MCSLIAHVEDGKVVRIQGDPDHPYTAGFACGKVNRDADLVNSPERIATPLKRTGPKGSGQFKPITWDEALDEIAAKWKAIIEESGPLALLGYAYSAHQGLMNRGLVNGLFHALGHLAPAGRHGVRHLLRGRPGTSRSARSAAPIPKSVVHSDLVISWGADLAATNVHFWALDEAQRKKRGVPIVVIDPRRTRSAKAADLYLPIRIGTDAALALGVMHILVRDKLADRDYIAQHTLGFDKVEREILPKFTPARTAEITGLAVADIEKLAAMYGKAKAALIRLGEGMTRLTAGGQALRTVALLPGVSGHYAVKGGGALLLTAASCDLNYDAVRKPSGPATRAHGQSPAAGRRAPEHEGPADPRALHLGQQSGGDLPRGPQGAEGAGARGPVHRGARSLHDRHREVRRHRAAGGELSRDRRSLSRLWRLLDAVGPAGRQAAGRSPLQLRRGAGARPAHGPHGQDLHARAAGRRDASCSRARPGRPPHADPAKLFAGEPIHIAHDWDGQPFKTPSGKLEFYSEQLAKQGVSPMPDWNEDPVEAAEAAKWPLRLLTAPGYFQAHTAFSGVGFLRSREGKPFCVLHPEDAATRGLKHGDEVRLFNDRGEIGLMLQVSDEIQPGVVLVPGQRPTSETVSGTINMLCSDRYTDMGEGATYQSTWLDVGPWKTTQQVARNNLPPLRR